MVSFAQQSLERLQCGVTSVLALGNKEELSRPTGETRQTGRKTLNVQVHGHVVGYTISGDSYPSWVRGWSLKAEAGKGQGVKGLIWMLRSWDSFPQGSMNHQKLTNGS